MLFRAAVLEGIAEGRITIAFRRWTRPTVKAGGSLRTAVGILSIDSVDMVSEADISEGDAVRAGAADRRQLLAELGKTPGGTLYRIAFRLAGDDPRVALRDDAGLDADAAAALCRKLASLDRNAPWTRVALRLIGAHPGRPATLLAADLGMEKPAAKRRIRALKALGLTESLDVGYRLSPRGKAFLNDHQASISPIE